MTDRPVDVQTMIDEEGVPAVHELVDWLAGSGFTWRRRAETAENTLAEVRDLANRRDVITDDELHTALDGDQ